MNKNNILGVGVTNAKKDEILEYIFTGLEKKGKKIEIFTPNPEILVFAQTHPDFQKVLNEANITLPDGVGVTLAGQLLARPFDKRITGVDFMLELCRHAAKRGLRIGLFGGKGEIAELTAECLRVKYPGLKITFASAKLPVSEAKDRVYSIKYNVYSKEKSNIQHTTYNIPKTDILFVALGYPKQEFWISEHLPHIDVKVAMAVGGSFDYISGVVPRAPVLFRNFGLEWLFRLLVQPWRFKRQLSLPKFLFLVLKEKFSPKSS